jgi:Mn2+/Fe2+ NRAMP family transporter
MDPKGWKTKTATICGGVYGVMSLGCDILMEPDPLWAIPISAALVLIVAMFAVFGLGDKITKLIEAITGKK